MYKITLADGTVLNDIGINATTLISKTPVDESIFEHNLSPVDIEWIGGNPPMFDISGHHENMEYQHIDSPIEGEYWFSLGDVPESEIRYAQLRADIEYMSMMMDIDL